ncbi:hypothetical protein AWN68_16015 [Roseivirga echinicomitans]|uniref:Uncharacterized protein n=1 Tax=Roseivirga echinicomitans TaxID=296218 RepID=A0A150XUC8_9BACT|nr:hypothetical protein AWN68_16015 [Roseivirga echinicomitans]
MDFRYLQAVTNITIDKDIRLRKTHFKDLEELKLELILVEEEAFELSPSQVKMLKEREDEADKATDKGLAWDRSLITRKHG